MTEICFNKDIKDSLVKVLIATKEETINYGITGNTIDRSTFNKLKALIERDDAENEEKKAIIKLDNLKEIVILLRTSNLSSEHDIQNLGAKLYQAIKNYKSATIYARHLPKTDFKDTDIINNLGLGIELEAYSFDKYHTKKKASEYPKLEYVNFIAKEKINSKIYEQTKALGNAVRYARDLINEPANELTPEIYSADIKRLESLGLKITILNENDLKKKGYDLALVGKGVTFDSGGISIKPSSGMWDMKQDMAGSAVVVASLKAAAQQKLNLNLVGIVGLVENMPSGTATRPGDVVKSLSGQTVEVQNTDAEGRLVLGDCLTYVEKEYKPERIIDIATLTGAIIVSLGNEMAGLFSNDDCLSELLTISGEQTGEQLWRLPMNDNYRKMIKSDIADIKNISSGRSAGSITAACFLEKFLMNKTPWAHLDIAGMDKIEKSRPMYPAGASGFGVLLINKLLKNIEQK